MYRNFFMCDMCGLKEIGTDGFSETYLMMFDFAKSEEHEGHMISREIYICPDCRKKVLDFINKDRSERLMSKIEI